MSITLINQFITYFRMKKARKNDEKSFILIYLNELSTQPNTRAQ